MTDDITHDKLDTLIKKLRKAEEKFRLADANHKASGILLAQARGDVMRIDAEIAKVFRSELPGAVRALRRKP